jgi:phospholipid/cholesterol/gamma-HCH transport system substrate-binding protein
VSKEFKIGLITVIAGGLLYYGFNFLRGSDLFSPSNRYYALYTNVSGLNVSNPIYFNGLPVGRVSGFKLQQNKGRIVVSLDIDEGVFLGKDANATLANDGLFGGKAIVLNVGTSLTPMNSGDTLASNMDGGMLEQFAPITDNLNTTINKLNTLLDHLNNADIEGTVDTLKYSIGSLTEKLNVIDLQEPIDNMNKMVLSFRDRSDQLKGVLESSKALMDSLKSLPLNSVIDNLNGSMIKMNEMMVAIQSEEGTIGKLINNDSLYNSMNQVMIDLDALLIHFNNYPKDFMKPLGRKHKKLEGISNKEGE